MAKAILSIDNGSSKKITLGHIETAKNHLYEGQIHLDSNGDDIKPGTFGLATHYHDGKKKRMRTYKTVAKGLYYTFKI